MIQETQKQSIRDPKDLKDPQPQTLNNINLNNFDLSSVMKKSQNFSTSNQSNGLQNKQNKE